MKKIYIKARAKVNLNLEILGKREDNYHNLESVLKILKILILLLLILKF